MSIDAAPALLLVEDDDRLAEALGTEFHERGYRVERAHDLAGVRACASRRFDFALVDLRLRRDNGLDAIELIHEGSPEARIVVLTGYGSIATAVRATKLGACCYLTKPAEIDEIERAFESGGENDACVATEFPSLARHEREYIEFVLDECDGNITHAAERLGLHRQSLQRKLRKYPPRT